MLTQRATWVKQLLWRQQMQAVINCVELLIDAGADVNTNNIKTALIWAAERGRDKCVKILIEAGADINIQNKNGETALMSAAHKGYDKIVKMLIEAGADVNVQAGVDHRFCDRRFKGPKLLFAAGDSLAQLPKKLRNSKQVKDEINLGELCRTLVVLVDKI